jgi:hypothetical protein
MIDWILGYYYAHTMTLALYAYALPGGALAVIYGKRTVAEYYNDIKSRAHCIEDRARYEREVAEYNAKSHEFGSRGYIASADVYTPTLKLGHIFWRLIAVVTPTLNVIMLVGNLDIVFEFIGSIADAIWNFFDIPLVPKR